VEAEAVASLQELGLSLYEARLYVGLVKHGPQNGNELSRSSSVPSSKVYSTLSKLSAAGIVQHIYRGSTHEYVGISPDELVQRLRERYRRPLDHLEEVLPTLRADRPDPDVVQISNAAAIVENAQAVIGRATGDVYLSVWAETLDDLRNALDAANERGVQIYAMLYGEAELDVGIQLHHSYQHTIETRVGGHMLTIVADGTEALFAHFPEDGQPTAVHTRNPVLCLVADEYLRHDLVLQKAKTMTGFREWDEWLQGDETVRSLTLGRTGHESSIEPV
jgi:HTH-type transcriptional regulator, sugar sensing transcriptional regulator